MRKQLEIDNLDAKIVAELKRNAREKTSHIALRLRVPEATVRLRLARLENTGVIKGYVPVLDYNKLGKPIKAVTTFRVAGSFSQKTLPKKILDTVDAVELYGLSGEIDAMLVLRGKDIKDINQKLAALRALPEIASSSTHFVLCEFSGSEG